MKPRDRIEQREIDAFVAELLPRAWILKVVAKSIDNGSAARLDNSTGWGTIAMELAVQDLIDQLERNSGYTLHEEEKGTEEVTA